MIPHMKKIYSEGIRNDMHIHSQKALPRFLPLGPSGAVSGPIALVPRFRRWFCRLTSTKSAASGEDSHCPQRACPLPSLSALPVLLFVI